MKIWLINPYGPIPGEGWRDYRFTLLGKELARRGYSVVWWTANFSHHFKRFRSRTWKDIDVVPNFRIRLVPTTSYSKNISLGRIRFEATFAKRMYQYAIEKKRPLVIIGTDPPQVVGYTAARLAYRFGVHLILDVFDLWPELFVFAFPRGFKILASVLLSPFYMLRKYNLRHADSLTALCQTYSKIVRKLAPDLPGQAIITVYNGIDVQAFRSLMHDSQKTGNSDRALGKEPGDIWVIYAGSLGNNYDVMTILKAAVLLQKRAANIKIYIAGVGPLSEIVSHFIEKRHLHNTIYLGKLEAVSLAMYYKMSDIGLCAYAPGSNVGMPDKAYDYMAAGLPIISSLPGEFETFLLRNQIGLQYKAGDSESLSAVLESLAANSFKRSTMARNSYIGAEFFNQHIQYGRFADLVEQFSITKETNQKSKCASQS